MPQMALAAYSIYQGAQAAKAAKDDAARRDQLTNNQIAMGKEDRDYYRNKFGPVNQMLIDYAMGNKPSPFLAKAKGHIEAGYQTGMKQLNEMQGNNNLGQTGIGAGQKIGFTMDKYKQEAALDLQDQAQRYGVASSLSQMENNSLQGTNTATRGMGQGAGYFNQDMQNDNKYAMGAYDSAARGVTGYVQNYMGGGSWYGAPPPDPKAAQANKIENPKV